MKKFAKVLLIVLAAALLGAVLCHFCPCCKKDEGECRCCGKVKDLLAKLCPCYKG